MIVAGNIASTSACPVRVRLGDRRATSIRPASRQAPSNQFSSTVLPLPRGPISATSCGGASPPSRSARHCPSTACSRSRPVSAGGAAPVPGVNRRCAVAFMARVWYDFHGQPSVRGREAHGQRTDPRRRRQAALHRPPFHRVRSEQVTLCVNPPRKDTVDRFPRDKPWEAFTTGWYSIDWDPEARRYKKWYAACDGDQWAGGSWRLCYAESRGRAGLGEARPGAGRVRRLPRQQHPDRRREAHLHLP